MVAILLFTSTLFAANFANVPSPPFLQKNNPQNSAFMTVQKADTYLLLAHKWSNGSIFLDLKINGTFEAKMDGKTWIYGYWSIPPNQETLNLCNDPIDEEVFKLEFTLSDISYHTIKLIDAQGKELVLGINKKEG